MSRRSLPRTAAAIGVSVASLAVGIVGARAIRGDGTSDTAASSPSDAEVVAGATAFSVVEGATTSAAAATDDELIPLLEPVAVSNDPTIAETLLFPPDDGAGTDDTGAAAVPHGEPGPGEWALAGAAPEPADASSGSDGSGGGGEPMLGEPPLAPTPWYVGLDGALLPFPIQFVDDCAGAAPRPPEMLPPPRCPEGVGGTVLGTDAVPPVSVWVNSGRHIDEPAHPTVVGCPATTPPTPAGQQAAMVVSGGPIATATVYWRPRGSTGGWESQTLDPAQLASQGALWAARLADGTLTPGLSVVTHCISFARDMNRAYEVYTTGTDTLDRPFTSIVATLPDLTPEGRPPTVVEVDGRTNRATVTAWTTTAGSVDFHWFPLAAGEDAPASACAGMLEYPFEARPGRAVNPVGVWDPQYSSGHSATFELPAGGGAVVCATIYDTENTLRPLATDVFEVRGPRRQVATIDLMGVRLNDGQTVRSGWLSVAARYMAEYVPDDGCSSWWTNVDLELTAPGVAVGDGMLWDCPYTPLPLDDRGFVKVPITVTRRVAPSGTDPYQRFVVGIPLQFDDCSLGYCPRKPTEFFEVPIPTGEMALRGCVFDCDGPPPSAGAAIVRVSWGIEGEGLTGSSVLLSSTDRSADPIDGTPHLTSVDRTPFVPAAGHRFTELRTEYDLFSDRPVTVLGGRMVPEYAGGDPACAGERPIEALTAEATTEPRVAVTVPCPAMVYSVFVRVRDAAGAEHEVHAIYDFAAHVVGRNVHTRVEFLGDLEGHEAGLIYEFSVGVGGSAAVTPSYAWHWSDTYPFGPGYLCVAHGRTVAASARPINQLEMFTPGPFTVGMNVNMPSLCDGSGSGRGAIGEVQLSGIFPLESLDADVPIVLESPADARLQVRITVSATDWVLVDG